LPTHPFFVNYLSQVRRFLGESWTPLRVARDGDGFPTVATTVAQLARCYAGPTATRNEDWIWEAMIREPDLLGGFNRLDTTIIKSGKGCVIAKEGADGLLGMGIVHQDYPNGLGVVIKVAHGWNPQASWYIARGVLGVLGIELRPPYPLYKQKAFLVPDIVPQQYLDRLESIPTWDSWDPDREVYFDYEFEPLM
jgi:L-asparaginase